MPPRKRPAAKKQQKRPAAKRGRTALGECGWLVECAEQWSQILPNI